MRTLRGLSKIECSTIQTLILKNKIELIYKKEKEGKA